MQNDLLNNPIKVCWTDGRSVNVSSLYSDLSTASTWGTVKDECQYECDGEVILVGVYLGKGRYNGPAYTVEIRED